MKHLIIVKNYLDRIVKAMSINDQIALNVIEGDANIDCFMHDNLTYEELVLIRRMIAYAIVGEEIPK